MRAVLMGWWRDLERSGVERADKEISLESGIWAKGQHFLSDLSFLIYHFAAKGQHFLSDL
jgi:hypothetical protein